MRIKLVILLGLFLVALIASFSCEVKFEAKSSPKTIIVPDDYPTIQGAIDAANEGDTIFVRSGVYYENVHIYKSLSLIGEDRNSTIIDGSSSKEKCQPIVSIEGGDYGSVSFSNFTIKGSKDSWGIYVGYWSGLSITNNIVMNNSGGIIIQECYSEWIIPCTLVGNIVRNNRNWGIVIAFSSHIIMKSNIVSYNKYNLVIEGNRLEDFVHDIDSTNTINGKPVYYLINKNNLKINPSSFQNVGYLAIVNSTNVVIENVTIQHNYQGVLLAFTKNVTLTNSKFLNNYYAVHIMGGSDNRIVKNEINDNVFGVFVADSYNNTVRDNLVTNNDIGIKVETNNTLLENLIISNKLGVQLEEGEAIGNTLINNEMGMFISSPARLRKNQFQKNSFNLGIYVNPYWDPSYHNPPWFKYEKIDIDTSNTIDGRPIFYWIKEKNRVIPNDAGYVALIDCENITLKNLSLSNNKEGILIVSSRDIQVKKVNVSFCMQGILIVNCYSLFQEVPPVIIDNCVINNITTISSLELTGLPYVQYRYPTAGIVVWNSPGVHVINSLITNVSAEGSIVDGVGLLSINLWSPKYPPEAFIGNNLFFNNTFIDNTAGILLAYSGNNTLQHNRIINNKHPFAMWGEGIKIAYIQSIESSNTIDGKSIYYLRGKKNMIIDSKTFPKIGHLALVECEDILVKNLTTSGITLAFSNRTTVENSAFRNNIFGLWLDTGMNITLKGSLSQDNFIGIAIHCSKNFSVFSNGISNNIFGLCIGGPSQGVVFHNNFINNKGQVQVGYDANVTWDNGYPSGGNYWSDYKDRYLNASDIYSGPYQNETGNDGIWDHPYIIDENNVDRYPLVHPFGQLPLTVPYEAQGTADWCWAASTAMVLRYYGKNVHVWDIGKKKPFLVTLNELETLIQLSYPDEFETEIKSYPSITNETKKDMITYLDMGYPLILHVETPGHGTHMVVVTGYHSTGFFINDPSGALLDAIGIDFDWPAINEYISWDELKPFIFREPISNNVFLVVKGTPNPIDVTLYLINKVGVWTEHGSDSEKGVCADYGGWWWFKGMYWKSNGWHPISFDSKDKLNYNFEIFNHNNWIKRFNFHFQIVGEDGITYYERHFLNFSIDPYDSQHVGEVEIPLKDYLVEGQQYTITAEITDAETNETIDCITLPPIAYSDNSIMFMAECPVKMLITDPDGLKIGYDPLSNQTINEISYAMYYPGNETRPEIIMIPYKKNGNYTIEIFGTQDGKYNLTCISLNQTGHISIWNITNIPISKDEHQIYIIPEYSSTRIMLSSILVITSVIVLISKKHK